MSVVCAAAWNHVGVWRAMPPLRPCLGPWFCCNWGLCWCLWPMLPLKAWWMSVFCVATWSHVDVYVLGYHRGPYWCLWPVLPRRPCWCPWPVLPPRVKMVSMACAVLTRDHVEVRSTCWHWRPCGCPWSMLLPKTMCKCMIRVPADCKGQRNYFCSIDYRFTIEKEGHRRLLWHPLSSLTSKK